MKITVYLASFEGRDPALKTAVRELGAWIGQAGHALVYGGSKAGLMGEIADSVLAAGGKVIGVEPQFLMDMDAQHTGLTQLEVTPTMADRKARLIELADAIIAFPGGSGTLEELSEVISRAAMGKIGVPVIIYNLNGYYDSLLAFFDRMVEDGLTTRERMSGISVASDLTGIRKILGQL